MVKIIHAGENTQQSFVLFCCDNSIWMCTLKREIGRVTASAILALVGGVGKKLVSWRTPRQFTPQFVVFLSEICDICCLWLTFFLAVITVTWRRWVLNRNRSFSLIICLLCVSIRNDGAVASCIHLGLGFISAKIIFKICKFLVYFDYIYDFKGCMEFYAPFYEGSDPI